MREPLASQIVNGGGCTFVVTAIGDYQRGQRAGIRCSHCTRKAVAIVAERGNSMALCDECLNLDQLGTGIGVGWPEPIRHPHVTDQPVSPSTYTNHSCRCDGCRSAWNSYNAERRARRASGNPVRPITRTRDRVRIARERGVSANDIMAIFGLDYTRYMAMVADDDTRLRRVTS